MPPFKVRKQTANPITKEEKTTGGAADRREEETTAERIGQRQPFFPSSALQRQQHRRRWRAERNFVISSRGLTVLRLVVPSKSSSRRPADARDVEPATKFSPPHSSRAGNGRSSREEALFSRVTSPTFFPPFLFPLCRGYLLLRLLGTEPSRLLSSYRLFPPLSLSLSFCACWRFFETTQVNLLPLRDVSTCFLIGDFFLFFEEGEGDGMGEERTLTKGGGMGGGRGLKPHAEMLATRKRALQCL